MHEPEPHQAHENPTQTLTPEEIAELKMRAAGPGPFYFGEQITARLQALEKEWERTGGFDETYLKSFLARLDEEEPPHYVVRPRIV